LYRGAGIAVERRRKLENPFINVIGETNKARAYLSVPYATIHPNWGLIITWLTNLNDKSLIGYIFSEKYVS
jgi:hypothetical protein